MDRFLNQSPQNYYFKDSVAYTEDHIPVHKLYIYDVPLQLTKCMLDEHFSTYGRVQRLQIFSQRKVRRGGRRLNTGCVFYADKTDAARALLSHVHNLNGLKFNVLASDSWHQPDGYEMPRPRAVDLLNTQPLPEPEIMSLNDYCLEHIMTYLTLKDQVHFARTCLRFRAVYQAATARLHKIVDLTQIKGMTVWDMRDFFKLSGAHVRTVSGRMPEAHAERLCDFLAANCKNLQTMNVISNIWSARNLKMVFAKMNKLETLGLPMSNISDNSLYALRNLRSLKSLNLSYSPLLGDTINKLPTTIESLTLNYCHYFEVSFLLDILRSLCHLKELNIKGIDPRGQEIYESIIKAKCCTSLETLRLTLYGNIRYEFVAQLPSLKHLSLFTRLSDRFKLRKELFEQLVAHKAGQLERLHIFGSLNVDGEVLRHIGKLGGLRCLILPRIESDAALVDAFCTDPQKRELDEFTLTESINVSDRTIVKMFRACRKLSCIKLEDRTSLGEDLVLGIVSCVKQEIANKDLQRKLPIEFWTFLPIDLGSVVEDNIIQFKYRSDLHCYGREFDFANNMDDDCCFDPEDLDLDDLEDSDLDDLDDSDSAEYESEYDDDEYDDIFDRGF